MFLAQKCIVLLVEKMLSKMQEVEIQRLQNFEIFRGTLHSFKPFKIFTWSVPVCCQWSEDYA